MNMQRDHDPNEGVRRFLEDLRSGTDRRRHERRVGERRFVGRVVEPERRTAPKRRDLNRRVRLDRRRSRFRRFTGREAKSIREMLSNPKIAVICPRCDCRLLLTSHNGFDIIHCTGCRCRVEVVSG